MGSNNVLQPTRFGNGVRIGGDDNVSFCGVKTRLSCTPDSGLFNTHYTHAERSGHLLCVIGGGRINNDYLEIIELLISRWYN